MKRKDLLIFGGATVVCYALTVVFFGVTPGHFDADYLRRFFLDNLILAQLLSVMACLVIAFWFKKQFNTKAWLFSFAGVLLVVGVSTLHYFAPYGFQTEADGRARVTYACIYGETDIGVRHTRASALGSLEFNCIMRHMPTSNGDLFMLLGLGSFEADPPQPQQILGFILSEAGIIASLVYGFRLAKIPLGKYLNKRV